jgi:hypothetical protein
MGDGAGLQQGVQVLPTTDKGKKQLVVEESQWKLMAEAVGRVMWPAAGES